MTEGSASQGAFFATVANFEENSPKCRCCDFSRISPKDAMSQNAVVPPLPSTTSYPSGRENRSVSPARTRATRFFTGFCRWEVPITFAPASARAASCSGRTFEGPQPKRPSAGLMSAGITMSATVQA